MKKIVHRPPAQRDSFSIFQEKSSVGKCILTLTLLGVRAFETKPNPETPCSHFYYTGLLRCTYLTYGDPIIKETADKTVPNGVGVTAREILVHASKCSRVRFAPECCGRNETSV